MCSKVSPNAHEKWSATKLPPRRGSAGGVHTAGSKPQRTQNPIMGAIHGKICHWHKSSSIIPLLAYASSWIMGRCG